MAVESLNLRSLIELPAIDFDRSEAILPPDEISIRIGAEGADLLRASRYCVNKAKQPMRVLVPGSGVGTLACGLLAEMYYNQEVGCSGGPLHIDAFDIEPAAVEMTRHNLAKYQKNTPDFSHDVFIADWDDQMLWDGLSSRRPYNLVLMNPPYFSTSHETTLSRNMRSGYEQVHRLAMFADDGGLKHYKTLIGHIPEVLSTQVGSGFLLRFETPGGAAAIELGRLMQQIFVPYGTPHDAQAYPTELITSPMEARNGSFARFIVLPEHNEDASEGARFLSSIKDSLRELDK